MDILKKQLSAIDSTIEFFENSTFTIVANAKCLHPIAEILKNEFQFTYLHDLIGVDNGDTLGVVYRLFTTEKNQKGIVLKVNVDREKPKVFSVCDLWESAKLYEREVFDFFGIKFINHPELHRLFLRQDWVGYPLRKDYDMNSNPLSLKNQTIEDLETAEVLTIGDNGEVVGSNFQLFGEKEYVVNIGPQHPATHGVLHLRVSLDGEIVKKIDPNFGYIHRGIEKMCESYTYPQILHLTDRLDYLSGTMNRHAMCLCIENALQMEVPQKAHYVRTIIDELTRIASHLLGWGCMCMDMGSITAFIYGMRDREKIMDIFEETGGGRLMCNYGVIGGLSKDIHPNFIKRVKEFIPYMRKMLKEYHTLFTFNPIASGRMRNIGFLTKEQAISLGVTGPSGRASGWSNDVRKLAPYAAYDKVNFNEVLRIEGGTYERYIVRLDEIEESLRIIEQLIDNLPDDGYCAKTKAVIKLPEGDFFQRVENARGDFGVYIQSRGDKNPYRVKFRSPCMTLVSALQPTVCGEKLADLIMIGASLDYVIPCIDR